MKEKLKSIRNFKVSDGTFLYYWEELKHSWSGVFGEDYNKFCCNRIGDGLWQISENSGQTEYKQILGTEVR